MYPQDEYQRLVATSTIVAVPVCVFLFIVSIFLMNLLVAQLSQSYHDAYSNMQAGPKVGRGVFGDVRHIYLSVRCLIGWWLIGFFTIQLFKTG